MSIFTLPNLWDPLNIAHYYNIVLAKTGEFLLGFYEDSTISRFQFFKVCKENGQDNSEFERETENKRVQEEKNWEEREAVEKKKKQLENREGQQYSSGMGFDGDDATPEIPAPPAASKIERLSLTKDYHQIIFDLETSGRGN